MAGQAQNRLSEQDEGQPPRSVGVRGADGVVYALSGVCEKARSIKALLTVKRGQLMRQGNIATRLGLRVDWAPSQRRGPCAYLDPTASPGPKEILILGGGFAGVYTARYLEKLLRADQASITLINRENY
jgi:hypothetical protein